MDEIVAQRMETVERTAKNDLVYRKMLAELRPLEKRYFEVLRTLPTDQQDIIYDFVSQCEEMSWRMLELACMNTYFPKA